MLKLRKGDMVQVIKGKDKGKKGKIITAFPKDRRVLVQGINFVKKHKKQTRQDQQGGIVSIEKPVSIANLMMVCKACGRAVRVGFKVSGNSEKARFCKSCKEEV